jgi:hypothetical protein
VLDDGREDDYHEYSGPASHGVFLREETVVERCWWFLQDNWRTVVGISFVAASAGFLAAVILMEFH